MEDKDIVLDEKTKKMILSLKNQVFLLEDKMSSILQTVVNVKFPDSNDIYELSKDGDKLVFIEESKEVVS